MARLEVDKKRLAGFAQDIVDTTGSTVKVDMKEAFGEVFEPFIRGNQWLGSMDFITSDQSRTVYKTNYKNIKGNVKDFDYSARNTGGDASVEEVQIQMSTTKDVSISFYEKDFLQANDPLKTIGERIKNELFVVADEAIDLAAEGIYVSTAAANTAVSKDLDIAAMEMTAANGEIVYGAIVQLVEDFKVSAKTNDYHRGERFKNAELVLKIHPKADELVTMFKAGYITEAGLLNAGVFGSQYRNVRAEVMEEGMTDTWAIVHTERAIQGVVEPVRHFKYIPEAINQASYTDEGNLVFGYGFKAVFPEEVASLKQPVARSKSE